MTDCVKDDALYQLFSENSAVTYKAGEVIARSDDDSHNVFYVRSGYVKVSSLNSRGEEYLHIIYKAGEFFPVIWMAGHLQQGILYSAIENVSLFVMDGRELLRKAQDDARLAMALAMQVVQQFNVYVDRVHNLEYKFGRERLIYRILFLAGRFGRLTPRGWCIDVPITQKALGSSVNLSRETVARELHRLETRGLVKYEDRRIMVLDVKQLCSQLKDHISADFWGLLPPKAEVDGK